MAGKEAPIPPALPLSGRVGIVIAMAISRSGGRRGFGEGLVVPMGILFALLLVLGGCAAPAPDRNLDDLVLRDSTYMEPETMEPFSGAVFRNFRNDSTRVEIQGVLREGTWEGELRVYHSSGRIRYMGTLAAGAQCGAWIENRDADRPESILEELKQDVESLGLYPQCPGDADGR